MSLSSMTGFARATGEEAGHDWTWEIRSVNSKGLDIRCRLPSGLEGIESDVRGAVSACLGRGSVSLTLSCRRAAGATEIIVRDSHGSALNLLPEMLHRSARLIRDWSGGPMSMMEGIDASYDAAIYVGYHAKAGTPNGVLDHTSSGDVTDISVNGISMPETGYNALLAGYYDVPVVFVAGDKAVCDQARALLGTVETVAVKEGIGAAAINLHPEVAREQIRAGVEKALRHLDDYQPYKLPAPYTMVLTLKTEQSIYNGDLYPGAKRTGDWELTYVAQDVLELMLAYRGMRR